MRKNNEFTTRVIKKSWPGGCNKYSFYLTIPSAVVKKIGITPDSLLSIEVVDDSIITIKKVDNKTGLTKKELERVRNAGKSESDDYAKEDNDIIGKTLPADFKNPLDDLDDI